MQYGQVFVAFYSRPIIAPVPSSIKSFRLPGTGWISWYSCPMISLFWRDTMKCLGKESCCYTFVTGSRIFMPQAPPESNTIEFMHMKFYDTPFYRQEVVPLWFGLESNSVGLTHSHWHSHWLKA